MKQLNKALHFIVSGRFYISLAALSLAVQTSLLFKFHLPIKPLAGFIFFATLFAYNVYYIDLRKPDYKYHRSTAILACIFAGLCFVYILSFIHWGVVIMVLIFGSLYTFSRYLPFRLFSHWLVKIFLLTSVWVLAVVILPMGKNIPSSHDFYFFTLHQFVLVFILNLLFDIKDIEVDEKQDNASLATKFGETKSYGMITLLEILLILILSYLMLNESSLKAYLVPMLIANFALTFSIRQTKSNKSIFPFLLFIDGLMILQALLVISTYYLIRYV